MKGGIGNEGRSRGVERLRLRGRALAVLRALLALRTGDEETLGRAANYLTRGETSFLGWTVGHVAVWTGEP